MQTISFRIDMWNDWSDDDDDEDLERRRWSVDSRRELIMPRTSHLGALDDEGLLTRLGRRMAEFPM